MKSSFGIATLASLSVCAGLVFLLMPSDDHVAGHESLILYCAAGISKPVQEVLNRYEQEYGVSVHVQFAGSGQLLSSIKTGGGDVYLAAAKTYLFDARKQNLVREIIPLAHQHPVLAVLKGNPKQITNINDLLQGDATSVQADADRTAIGRVARKLLTPEVWQQLVKRATVERATVNEVANDIKTGIADAGILWSATAEQYPDLEIVEVPQLASSPNQITVGILSSSKLPRQALHFARFMAARDRGLLEFSKFGYQVIAGDKWSEKPEITFFAGGLNRLAVE
ncbi:MAG: extracellular solute-binding protein, partial [Planctomycetaceae bacterium]